MGLKDLFSSEGRAEAKLKRNLARVANKNLQSPDRVRAIEVLRDIGGDEAIVGLLRRFNLRYDKSIEDEQEKDYVYDILCGLGDKILPALKRYLLESASLSWGLKVLHQIATPVQLWEMLDALLAKIQPGYERDPAPKQQILSFLGELAAPDPRIVAATSPYLEDVDEGVRFLAVEVLIKHGDLSSREPLALRILNDDSLRLRIAATEGFVDRGWSLPSASDGQSGGPQGSDRPFADLADKLPEGFYVEKKSGKVRRAGSKSG